MTNQQMQYAYWQRMRQQQLYRAYVAGNAYAKKENEYEGLCFTAEEACSTIKLQNVEGEYQTSTNGQNWIDYELGQNITLANIGDKVYFAAKTTNDSCYKADTDNIKFSMTGKIAASGNIQSLLDKECNRTDVPEHCYSCIFKDCTSLTKPPMLPATTLKELCYDAMFLSCTALTTAPALPATAIAERCYQYMFKECHSLTATPELPAATLMPNCYDTMFENCVSLTTSPTLSAENLAEYCYMNMFKGCINLISVSNLPATTLEPYCYNSMFNGCTSLKISENKEGGTIVLNLPSTTIEKDDWNVDMFADTAGTFTAGNPAIGETYRCY